MEEKRSAPFSTLSDTDVPVPHMASGTSSSTNSTPPTFLDTIWRGKWLVLLVTAIFCLVALMLGALQVPLYRAQTSIELQSPSVSRSSQAGDSSGDQTPDAYVETQIRIIQSRSLVERILAKFSDSERSRLLAAHRFWWARASYDQNLESIRKNISAKVAPQAGIVDISFLAPDPEVGAHFLNSLTQELADLNVERAWHAAQRNRQWTDRQLEDLRRKWEQSEQVLAEYTQASRLDKVSLPAPRQHASSSQLPLDGNDPQLRQLKAHLADLNRQIAQWESLYGPSAAPVLKLKSQASETALAIRHRKNQMLRMSQDASGASISPAVITAPESVTNRAQAMAHFEVLKQDAESNQKIYEATAARLKEADVSAASHLGDISVVDPAIAVSHPIIPNQLLNGFIGALVGLLAGMSFVMLHDRFALTFTEPAVLSRYLGLNVLGAIPANNVAQSLRSYGPKPNQADLHISFGSDAKIAEAYRSVRSSILLRANQRSGPRRLLFTSAGTSEGKTSVVGNLGAALAGAQRRVLLVDGDLRNPSLHKFFCTGNDHGLADLLSRQITASPLASRDVIRETQIPDLYLLSAGLAGDRAPEILSSIQLPQLIREFAKAFDLVLIDSPPILPYADARSLARAADAVILVVKAGATQRRDALLARDSISQDGAHITGTILTEWNTAQSAFA